MPKKSIRKLNLFALSQKIATAFVYCMVTKGERQKINSIFVVVVVLLVVVFCHSF